ncbi:Uncharacterised protein [Rikenella microfusus]|uniref:Uncharacterized protein n=1 Tax=Rikenella microfusus TaxID=28139 RepID=A0A379MMM5_9BACT|nr:Uncharacterised protein [Rikenella microfusus]
MFPLHFYEAEVCGGIMVSVRDTCRTTFESVIRKPAGYVAATAVLPIPAGRRQRNLVIAGYGIPYGRRIWAGDVFCLY